MVYICQPCMEVNGLFSMSRSAGTCELCNRTMMVCGDIPSALLPAGLKSSTEQAEPTLAGAFDDLVAVSVEPGDWAAIEGRHAEFQYLTKRLMELRLQAMTMVLPGNDNDTEIVFDPNLEGVRQEHLELLAKYLPDEEIKTSFISFLISVMCEVKENDKVIRRYVNQISNAVGVIAPLMGMVPVADMPDGDLGVGNGETFITSAGQKLFNVHRKDDCVDWCVIHNPMPGPWADWKVIWRGGDLFDLWQGFERICPCGVGHTAVEETLRGNTNSHGCCGICPCGITQEGEGK